MPVPPVPPVPPYSRPLRVADPHHVDFIDLLAQAGPVARLIDPGAKFMTAHIDRMDGGTVDTAGPVAATVNIVFQTPDLQSTITVKPWSNLLIAERSREAYVVVTAEPTCRSSAVWAAVLRDGVKPHLDARFIFTGREWLVMPSSSPGTLELPRRVDGRTCRVIPTFKKRPATAEVPKAHPARNRDCGCADDDLVCGIRCRAGN